MKNILFISPTVPYPATDGGRIRVLNLLKQICKKNRITFVAIEILDTDKNGIEHLRNLGMDAHLIERMPDMPELTAKTISVSAIFRAVAHAQPVMVAKYYIPAMEATIKKLLHAHNFDVIHFEMLHTGQYIKKLEDLKAPALLSLQNVDSSVWRRLVGRENNPIKKLLFFVQSHSFARYEKRMCPLFSACACVSEEDKKLLKDLCPLLPIEVIPNGVDIEGYQPDHNLEEEAAIVYTGSMDWQPNEDAVLYFHEQIFPLILKELPDAKFYVVGQYPTERIRSLAKNPNVIVTGMVGDTRPYFAKASVYVVPLRIGGGTRLKILEALGMEKAVVSTTIGYEGLHIIPDEDILVADDEKKFAELVIKLAKDKGLRRKLGKKGRKTVGAKYNWTTIGEKLNDLYENLLL